MFSLSENNFHGKRMLISNIPSRQAILQLNGLRPIKKETIETCIGTIPKNRDMRQFSLSQSMSQYSLCTTKYVYPLGTPIVLFQSFVQSFLLNPIFIKPDFPSIFCSQFNSRAASQNAFMLEAHSGSGISAVPYLASFRPLKRAMICRILKKLLKSRRS